MVDPLKDGKVHYESKIHQSLNAFEIIWMAEALGCFHGYGHVLPLILEISYEKQFEGRFDHFFSDFDQDLIEASHRGYEL